MDSTGSMLVCINRAEPALAAQTLLYKPARKRVAISRPVEWAGWVLWQVWGEDLYSKLNSAYLITGLKMTTQIQPKSPFISKLCLVSQIAIYGPIRTHPINPIINANQNPNKIKTGHILFGLKKPNQPQKISRLC